MEQVVQVAPLVTQAILVLLATLAIQEIMAMGEPVATQVQPEIMV
jgi:hypothetical protein